MLVDTTLDNMTTTHKFPSLFVGEKVLVGPGKGHVEAEQHLAGGQDSFPVARVEGGVEGHLGHAARVGGDSQPAAGRHEDGVEVGDGAAGHDVAPHRRNISDLLP